jgi:hypothetical protein
VTPPILHYPVRHGLTILPIPPVLRPVSPRYRTHPSLVTTHTFFPLCPLWSFVVSSLPCSAWLDRDGSSANALKARRMGGRGDFGYHLRHARVWCCGLALGIPGWDRNGGMGRWGGIGGRRRVLGLYIGGYEQTPTRGMQRTRPGAREAHAVVPAFCCPLPTVPSPHLCADVVCNSAASIHARRDTSAAVHSLSLTSFHSILVSTSKVQQIAKTGPRREEGMKGDAGLRLRHAHRRPTPLLRAVTRRYGRARAYRGSSPSDTVPHTLHIVPADPDPSDPTPQTRALPHSRVGARPLASHSFPSVGVG